MVFKVDIISAVPQVLDSFVNESILKRGIENKFIDIKVHNLRDWTFDKHKIIDDTPYGGGPGMIMKPDPLVKAIRDLKNENSLVILTTPRGKVLNQNTVRNFLTYSHLIIVCGHYKGIDERVSKFIDCEVSVGDFILTGGEIPAAIITDSVCRLIPGVISDIDSANSDSFENGLLDCDYYTRPLDFEGDKVPEILTSGNHGKIKEWKQNNALSKTKANRIDVYETYLENLKK